MQFGGMRLVMGVKRGTFSKVKCPAKVMEELEELESLIVEIPNLDDELLEFTT